MRGMPEGVPFFMGVGIGFIKNMDSAFWIKVLRRFRMGLPLQYLLYGFQQIHQVYCPTYVTNDNG